MVDILNGVKSTSWSADDAYTYMFHFFFILRLRYRYTDNNYK